MKEKKQYTLAEALHEVIQKDPHILQNSEALFSALEPYKNGFLSEIRVYRQIENAFKFCNAGDILLAAEETKEDTKAARDQAMDQITASLREHQMQEESIKRLKQLLIQALGWDKTSEKTEKKENPSAEQIVAKQAEMDAPKKEQPHEKWNCICGETANTGNFCVSCGRAREVGEQKNTTSVRGETEVKKAINPGQPPVYQKPVYPPNSVQQGNAQQPYIQPGARPLPSGGNGHTGKKIAIVAAVMLIAAGIFAVWCSSSANETSKADQQIARTTQETSGKEDKQGALKDVKNNEKSNAEKKNTSAQSELSLGNVDLGIPMNDCIQILGKPKKDKEEGIFHTLSYEDMGVGIKNGRVDALISNTARVRTKRGIHEGSTVDEVTEAYGGGYERGKDGNHPFYEYSFTSIDGRKGVLRFAFDANQRVYYVSTRIVG